MILKRISLLSVIALFGIFACSSQPDVGSMSEAQLEEFARGIHDRVIALDTHNDINPNNFTMERNYTQDLNTQVNLPKMESGGLDASFFIVYVGQSDRTAEGYERAYATAIEKFDAIHRLTEEIAPDRIELALTEEDVRRIDASGKKVALIGVENAYSIGEDLSKVEEFQKRGARYMSLTHNGHSQFADSQSGRLRTAEGSIDEGESIYDGVSELGEKLIAELNRVGIMVDISHSSKKTMLDITRLSKAPVIASHSAVRALCDVGRNLDDEQLLALKENGGVLQTVAFNSYVKERQPDSPERQAALNELREEFGLPAGGRGGFGGRGALQALSAEQREKYREKLSVINETYPPPPRANVQDFVDHIDYAVNLIGIDHVGISSDFDGGGGIDGWSNSSETFNVTLELVKRGYTEDRIAKLWSGNLLRVLTEVQKIAEGMQE